MLSEYLVPVVLASLAVALPHQPMHQGHTTSLAARTGSVNLLDETAVEAAFERAVKARDSRRVKKRANQLIPIVVGGSQDLFMPNMMLAAVGDVIQFQFAAGNHTVTQSTETEACTPLQRTNASAVHSGHIPFQSGQTAVGTFNVPVVDTKPMFLYCATGPHCQTGQVMIINPSNSAQVVNYAKLSAAAAANVDGGAPSGGTAGSIQLSEAAFIESKTGGGPPAGGAGGAPAASSAPAATTSEASQATQTTGGELDTTTGTTEDTAVSTGTPGDTSVPKAASF